MFVVSPKTRVAMRAKHPHKLKGRQFTIYQLIRDREMKSLEGYMFMVYTAVLNAYTQNRKRRLS